MRRYKQMWLWWTLLAPALLGLAACFMPLDRAREIGGDDGYELCKAQLLERRPDLAARMWNDQPWLDTMVVARLFRVLGEHAVIPRALSLISVAVMVLGIGYVVRGSGTAVEWSLFPLFFLTAFPMPQLAMSAMLEIPAVACAVVSLALLGDQEGTWARGRLVLSGCAFGAALQIKLTSVILVGGLVVLLCYGKTLKEAGRSLALWCGAALCAWGPIAWTSPAFDPHTLFASHLAAGRAMPEAARKVFAFSYVDLIRSPALCLGAGVGIAGLWRRRERGLLAVLALLAGGIVFGLLHRPWWQYLLDLSQPADGRVCGPGGRASDSGLPQRVGQAIEPGASAGIRGSCSGRRRGCRQGRHAGDDRSGRGSLVGELQRAGNGQRVEERPWRPWHPGQRARDGDAAVR